MSNIALLHHNRSLSIFNIRGFNDVNFVRTKKILSLFQYLTKNSSASVTQPTAEAA